MYEWVGLRPGRDTLRVELEKKTINGKPLTVRHFLVIVLTACCESPQSFSFLAGHTKLRTRRIR